MAAFSEELERKRQLLPDRPGVYLMKDDEGHVIYVGKAVNLKQRVRSYFQDPARLAPKVAAMMRHVADFEIIATDTEVEALILEATLVKQMQPHYNIRLKDDKAYPYLRLTWEEDFPRLVIARKPSEPGSRYFGPYTRSQSVHETIRLLRKIFPIRNCTNMKFKNAARPCLEYHIHRCQAPCQNLVEKAVYREMMKSVELFLEGKADHVRDHLLQQMNEAADSLQFERAAKLRDQVRAIEEITAQQKVAAEAGRNLDAISWVVERPDAYVQVFRVRDGRLTGRESMVMTGVDGTNDAELARAFLLQYYERANEIPQEILVEHLPEEADDLRNWLRQERHGKIELKVPQRGEKQRLLAMVRQNAVIARDEALRRVEVKEREREEALLGLKATLGLSKTPERIECYDISNTQGTESVASMVVFTNGKPDKSQYRRFKIQTVQGPNDFLSMREVIGRRFRHQQLAEDSVHTKRFAKTPDLVIIDGGRGQLGYAYQAMEEAGVSDIPVFGLAKEHEWLFEPHRPDPIILDRESPPLKLLQHVRDEAHRFAITFHRQLRTKRNLASVLDEVPGIGPKRKKAVLRHYPDLGTLARSESSLEDLAKLPGMNKKAAESVMAYLRKTYGENPEGGV
ncbi:MAG: excinuclease ABC subunit C [Sulfobacillus benefaciens]|uniref:UvrABC system protein C n=1 Tax=Sulfobacillus benefaciens TaxID=453960 RepID=A0A2T2XFD0_9FIRM|nr:MAG: excinuclease ABC subunit C [Sulfobacillus benefaciens]